MSKTCPYHQCHQLANCDDKIKLGHLSLCGQNKKSCRYRAPLPYGRYEPEDILLP